jgi:hypothetical protein
MPTVQAFFPICGTRGDLTYYLWEGKNFVRKKSSLTARKVKTSPRFERTRYYAGLMAQASQIGSSLYQLLPVRWRQSWMYRTFTGEAVKLLKVGKTREEVKEILWAIYIKDIQEAISKRSLEIDNNQLIVGEAAAIPSTNTTVCKTKRPYTKKNTAYWMHKTAKVNKRKSKHEKLQRYANLLARASVIGSAVYKSLPIHRQKHALYKALTGSAMALLKNELPDENVKGFLMKKMQEKNNKLLPGSYTLTKTFGNTQAVYKASARSAKRRLLPREQMPFESDNYSVRRLFTGFTRAAFIAFTLTVTRAMPNVINAASTKTHQLKEVL